MNEILSAILLGVVQGLTEFLPVSSSGHLVLFHSFLGASGDQVMFDLVLHVGTLLPVLVVYREDLLGIVRDVFAGEVPFLERRGVRLLLLMIVGTIPTGIIGLLLEDVFEQLFSNVLSVGIALGVTGFVLWSTRYASPGKQDERTMPVWKAIVIGLAQGAAITPGISRSGSTIAAALLLGLDRETAARYSFLLSIPAISGAFILKLGDVEGGDVSLLPLIVGFVAAAVSGYLALRFLIGLVRRGDFSRFSWYLWPLSAVTIAWALFA
ncbi:MAG: undecaprenyl-diphosphate phosphatase [Myxococcota bacterium]|nr:undecaprenyl-diphosphate phosphatase [Myxococcota bacterium]